MDKKFLNFVLILLVGFSGLSNALQYFISGKQHSNTDLRNYAVIGQIIFALAIIASGIWYYKTSFKKID